jgi:hypothetical protein
MDNAKSVVNNPRTTGKILDEYKDSINADVRCGVAQNSNTTPETLDYMKDDKEWWVRREIAQNSNTSIETLMYIYENNYKKECREEIIVALSKKELYNLDEELKDKICKILCDIIKERRTKWKMLKK